MHHACQPKCCRRCPSQFTRKVDEFELKRCVPCNCLSMPLFTLTDALCPACLYAFRMGTLSLLISTSSTISCRPGATRCLRKKVAGFQSGASSAQNLASYHFSRPSYCMRSYRSMLYDAELFWCGMCTSNASLNCLVGQCVHCACRHTSFSSTACAWAMM